MLKSGNKTVLIQVAVFIFLVAVAVIYYVSREPEVLPPIPIAEVENKVPDFSIYERVQDKKTAFFDYLMPVVKQQNDYILNLRLIVSNLKDVYAAGESFTEHQQAQLNKLVDEYNVDASLSIEKQLDLLMMRVDIIPIDLVLVQAANESAWGTSRFAKQGFNFYGLWCFKKGCGFVPKYRNEGAEHEVAKFDNVSRATYTYMRNLNRHPAYKELREIRRKLRLNQKAINGTALSEGLLRYSERGEDYIDELQQMIRVNKPFIGA